MIGGADRQLQLGESYIDSPTDGFPVGAYLAELKRLWCLIGVRGNEAHGLDPCIRKREHHIAGRNFAHKIVEWITGAVSISLGRPKITPAHFVTIGLILVNPPGAHAARLLMNMQAHRTDERCPLDRAP